MRGQRGQGHLERGLGRARPLVEEGGLRGRSELVATAGARLDRSIAGHLDRSDSGPDPVAGQDDVHATVAVAGVAHLDRQVGPELRVTEPADLGYGRDVAPSGRGQVLPRLADALLLREAERRRSQVQRQLPTLEDGHSGLRMLVQERRGRVSRQEAGRAQDRGQ